MEEFAKEIGQEAAAVMRKMYQQEVPTGTNPVLELMGCLLDDGGGGVLLPPDVPVTTEQWLTWNRLALDRPEKLVRTLIEVLAREQTVLPMEEEAMRTWAAQLLLSTLDQLGML